MPTMPGSVRTRVVPLVMLGCAAAWSATGADDGVATVKNMLSRLAEYQTNHGADHGWSIAFRFPEAVVNQYVKYLITSRVRTGVKDASLKLAGSGTVEVTCNVDLARIREWSPELSKSGSPLADKAALAVVAGFNVTVDGDSATVKSGSITSGDPAVDAALAQRVLQILAANQPEHFDLSKPVKLPFTFKKLAIDPGVLVGETQ